MVAQTGALLFYGVKDTAVWKISALPAWHIREAF
jgi:hypothetical protein